MTTAIVPIKPFAEAKQRLSSDLDGVQRRALAAMTASHVVMACHTAGLPVAVVTDDDEVAVWASERGCRIVADPGSGLSDAVAVAVDEVDGPWLAVHADLPLLAEHHVRSAVRAIGAGRAVLAPSLDGGTNLLGAAESITLSYGRSSFSRHLAATAHLERTVIVSTGTVVDIDGPDDLRRAAALAEGAWLQAFLTSAA